MTSQPRGIRIALVLFSLLAAQGAALARDLPRFEAKTVGGEDYRFADVVGKKVIVIDFWATYCINCRPQLDALDRIYRQHKDKGLEVVIISVDTPQNVGKIKPYFQTRGYPFTVLLDTDSQIARILKPTTGLPYTLLIDKAGEIVYQHEGFKKGEEKALEEKILALLGPAATPAEAGAKPEAGAEGGTAAQGEAKKP